MKVLALMGSPRNNGSTYMAVEMVEERLREMGEIEMEYVHLKDMDLGECIGCHACIHLGEAHCPVDGDRGEIEKRMLGADALILASPVYSLGVTSLVKKFLDRFSYCFHRPRFFGLPVLAIATAAGAGQKASSHLMADCARFWGCAPVYTVELPKLDLNLTDAHREKVLRTLRGAAEKIFRATQCSGPPRPAFRDLVAFRVWRDLAANSEPDSADHVHWRDRGWLEADYYYPTSIPGYYRLSLRLIEGLMRRYSGRVYGDA